MPIDKTPEHRSKPPKIRKFGGSMTFFFIWLISRMAANGQFTAWNRIGHTERSLSIVR